MRMTFNMNMVEAIVAMVDGNPGATTVCMQLVTSKKDGFIDVCRLDEMEIYGSDIWLCYKDICKEDIEELRRRIRDQEIKEDLKNLKKQ